MTNTPFDSAAGGEPIPAGGLLVTPGQLAAWLQVSVRSLWRMNSAGELPAAVRLRKAVRWRASDIEAWLAAGCPAGQAIEQD